MTSSSAYLTTALYDFEGDHADPSVVSFVRGQSMLVMSSPDEAGWVRVECNGLVGFAPSSYLAAPAAVDNAAAPQPPPESSAQHTNGSDDVPHARQTGRIYPQPAQGRSNTLRATTASSKSMASSLMSVTLGQDFFSRKPLSQQKKEVSLKRQKLREREEQRQRTASSGALASAAKGGQPPKSGKKRGKRGKRGKGKEGGKGGAAAAAAAARTPLLSSLRTGEGSDGEGDDNEYADDNSRGDGGAGGDDGESDGDSDDASFSVAAKMVASGIDDRVWVVFV